MKPRIIAIAGPTASGKTDISIKIAQKLKTEVISFDSRQFYHELNIGVARPTPEQLSAVPHHFIANKSIHDPYSAATFAEEARHTIKEILRNHEQVVLCGGTGLYLKAVLQGFSILPETPAAIRKKVESIWVNEGINGLQQLLMSIDTEAIQRVEKQNPARLKRAAELLLSSPNKTLKEIYSPKMEGINDPFMIFNLIPDREVLYARIEQRVDSMIANGLIKEAESLVSFKDMPVLKTVGYSELFDYFEGNTTLDDAILKIKQHTRNYAKRQITWFKNQTDGIIIQPGTAVETVFKTI